ncbi:MAG: Uma2 family endonuclease [Candidatus Competibacteraceae bacterium]|nr:Uma2 family endonuclease [Candidatus Competibacteraceae bacterium]MCP5125222.1 Uma2 family endonuclease [Gammaproteobacteria bacterium]HRX70948.1 Uma2 family endonuclease [Candidatus Competibacteraceae bacterium]
MNAVIEPRRHWITVEEYHQMGEAGIFDEDARIELLEGELFDMAPIGSKHANTVARLVHLFYAARDSAVVWVQNPIALARSEPEPDVALLKSGNYWDHLPTVDDVLLLIEVADSSMQYDREKKIPVYGRCGIAETWLVDVNARQVEIYREPSPAGYRTVLIRSEQDCIALVALPELEIALGEIWRSS